MGTPELVFRGNCFEVTYPRRGLDTAVEATGGTSGPRVVVCYECDALPEVGHACGDTVNHRSEFATRTVVSGSEPRCVTGRLGWRTPLSTRRADIWDRPRA
ncbi:MAG: hypothetical protein Ct9H300mP12_17330 [Acidimicrobiales bacterium]|nr:MAG: hypothetical protein Ct9H300mP12_17330 [Acidimicrobiales bacterium]